MLIVYSGQSNTVTLKAVAKASGDPIEAGTVNLYLKALSGDDAGKWHQGSTGTWEASESVAGAGTHDSDGDWYLTLASAVWTSHVHYRVYLIESGDLHVPNADDIICAPYGGSIIAGSGPITRDVVKSHLRITHDAADDDIDQMILAATAICEDYHRRIYVSRQLTKVFDKFPAVIEPPGCPLVSVDSIAYVDEAGDPQTLNASLYEVDTAKEPGRVVPAYGQSWPATRGPLNAVTVTYTAGYGQAADVPDIAKIAIKMLVAHLYYNRGREGAETFPQHVKDLLGPTRVFF